MRREKLRQQIQPNQPIADTESSIDEIKMEKEIALHLQNIIDLKKNLENNEKKKSFTELKTAAIIIDQFFNRIEQYQKQFPIIWQKILPKINNLLATAFPQLNYLKKKHIQNYLLSIQYLTI